MRTEMVSRKSTPLVRVALGTSWVVGAVIAAKPDNATSSARVRREFMRRSVRCVTVVQHTHALWLTCPRFPISTQKAPLIAVLLPGLGSVVEPPASRVSSIGGRILLTSVRLQQFVETIERAYAAARVASQAAPQNWRPHLLKLRMLVEFFDFIVTLLLKCRKFSFVAPGGSQAAIFSGK